MAVDKFKFLSPGIQVNEIDESGVEEVKTQATAPVIIGRTERGPAMRPVQIDSVAELNRVFGNTYNGNQSGDIWRDGGKQAPTLATIAAEAYLRNSGPVTVVRLLGEQAATPTSAAGYAGWKVDSNNTDVSIAAQASGAFGLYVWPWNGVTGSAANIATGVNGGTGSLAAVIYTKGAIPFLYAKTPASGSITLNPANSSDSGSFINSTLRATTSSGGQLKLNGTFIGSFSGVGTGSVGGTSFTGVQTSSFTSFTSVSLTLDSFTSLSLTSSDSIVSTFSGNMGAGGVFNGFFSGTINSTAYNNLTGSSSSEAFLTSSVAIGTGGNKNEFIIAISSSTGAAKKSISFDSSKSNYIRNVLNTDAVKINSAFGATEKYFLGETFEGFLKNTYGTSQNLFAAIVPMKSAQSNYNVANKEAKTSWIVSQDMGEAGSFEANSTTGAYAGVKNLFRFVTLSGGETDQKTYKISIENVTKPVNVSVDAYGTFDVVIRDLVESTVLERYNGVNLNPVSSKYIAKVIGDMYQTWNHDLAAYETSGQYPNVSARIRVDMGEAQPASCLPFGFYTNVVYNNVSNIVTATGSIENDTVSKGELATLALPVSYPVINLKSTNGSTSLARTRWGLNIVKATDTDLSDIVRIKGGGVDSYDYTSGTTKYGKLFTLDEIVISGSTGTWTLGSRKAGTAYSVTNSSLDVLTYADSFDVPLLGGFDGLNILEKESIVNERILTDGSDSQTNYAYETIERALLSVSDAEVVDCDIICVPGLKSETLTNKLIDICEQRGDSLALIDIENDYVPAYEANGNVEVLPDVSTAVSSLKARALDTSYAAAYFPAVFLSNENIFVPASIAALGVLGGTKGNSALWFAPAGFNRGGLTRTTSGLSVSRTAKHLTSANRDSLYEVSVNPIATFPAEGVVVFGQKTLLASPSALDRVNVRRLMNYVKKEISKAANQVIFEPNVERTWNNFKGLVEPFLDGIKVNFGLDDYRVILDERTTTADLIDRNIMYAKILLKPTRTIEFIALDFVVSNSGAIFEG